MPRSYRATESLKLRGNAPHSGGQIPKDQLRIEAKDAIAEAAELFISAGIGGALAGMRTTIHFDHEVNFGSQEIHDEAVDRNLAAKDDAELFPERQRHRSSSDGVGS